MKRFIICLLTVVTFMITSVGLSAQDNNNNQRGRWEERMRSEKIGFLTSFMDLSEKEAQAFWPIYNRAQKEESAAMEANFRAFHALEKAIQDKKNDTEIKNLLHAYIKAAQDEANVNAKYEKEYEKVLPASKVAKLYVAEEQFRRQQIMKLPMYQVPRPGKYGAPGQNNNVKEK